VCIENKRRNRNIGVLRREKSILKSENDNYLRKKLNRKMIIQNKRKKNNSRSKTMMRCQMP
jgi:hypothetical protein